MIQAAGITLDAPKMCRTSLSAKLKTLPFFAPSFFLFFTLLPIYSFAFSPFFFFLIF